MRRASLRCTRRCMALALAALAGGVLSGGAHAGAAPSGQGVGRLVLVSVEEPRDPRILAAIGARGGELVELRIAPEPADGGDPAEPAGEAAAGRFGGSDPILLRPGDRAAANERGLEARLASAGTIVLSGGSLLEWYEVFSPRRHPTGVRHGLLRALRSGADVVGLGGGAAYLAGASLVPRDELDRPRRNPRDRRVFVAVVGLGLGPRGIVEVDPLPGEHALRLLGELLETRVDLGFRMEGEVALVVDWNALRHRVVGPGRVVVLDIDGAREDRGVLRGARLSVLLAGDAWDPGHRRPLPAPERERVPGAPRGAGETGPRAEIAAEELAAGLGAALAPLAERGTAGLALEGPFGRLELGHDARSRRWRGPDGTSLHLLTLAWRPPGTVP